METTHQNERDKLFEYYYNKIEVNEDLSRNIVSFQAAKKEPIHRWFKYKEAYSPNLIRYLLEKYDLTPGKVLDPFAGIGTTLFISRDYGWETTGIEILPVGYFVMKTRLVLDKIKYPEIKKITDTLWESIKNVKSDIIHINHVRITEGAFSEETESLLNKYLTYSKNLKNKNLSILLKFVAFTVLEDISYTRKDGQYLRWDCRAPRNVRTKFKKLKIYPFKEAINSKLNQILDDFRTPEMENFSSNGNRNNHTLNKFLNTNEIKKHIPKIILGSSLHIIPEIEKNQFDLIITSPPYCNRYDYTRTYALELVFLNNKDEDIKDLRQSLLSCTVENREKKQELKKIYEKNNRISDYKKILDIYENIDAIQEVNNVMNTLREKKKLNNNGVVRMVKNYILEMCFIIFEMYRVLKSNGIVVIVNDNVQYGGEEVPLDILLSNFAEKVGFYIEKIWILPVGKGNSSQQMGKHGRNELRKCVYVWRKK